jgi:cytochrome c oxidase subunit IV
MTEGTLSRREEVSIATHGELGAAMEPAPTLLPGEVDPHPSPFKYVMIALVLMVVTATEVAVSYLDGDIPTGLIVLLLMVMMVIKFAMVAAWYMHLKTDKPIFHRFFILGIVAAVLLYTIVLTTLHVFA